MFDVVSKVFISIVMVSILCVKVRNYYWKRDSK